VGVNVEGDVVDSYCFNAGRGRAILTTLHASLPQVSCKRLLREAERVLVPEGYLILLGLDAWQIAWFEPCRKIDPFVCPCHPL